MVVDGQIIGGVAQGIGTALYEEMPFDEHGQPLASTLADYMLPGAPEVPSIRIQHIESPSPYTQFGQKGLGEGRSIAPRAAIVNAIPASEAPKHDVKGHESYYEADEQHVHSLCPVSSNPSTGVPVAGAVQGSLEAAQVHH
jgi:xanthine dehydrogenase molybdopterin-binding subunit B